MYLFCHGCKNWNFCRCQNFLLHLWLRIIIFGCMENLQFWIFYADNKVEIQATSLTWAIDVCQIFGIFQSSVGIKDACTVKPGFKPVCQSSTALLWICHSFSALAGPEKNRPIQNKAVEELIWIRVLPCKHLYWHVFSIWWSSPWNVVWGGNDCCQETAHELSLVKLSKLEKTVCQAEQKVTAQKRLSTRGHHNFAGSKLEKNV